MDRLLLDVLHAALDRSGVQEWLVTPSPIWCTVLAPAGVTRPHGWKLHVSATPLSAPHVLARAADVLFRHGASFKFATDIASVIALVGPHQDRGTSGKFITVYPEDDTQARFLATELDTVTADLVGPRILSDRPVRPGSLVHCRYGQFAGSAVFSDHGVFESWMVGPDGSLFSDERTAWFAPPPWAVPLLPFSAASDSAMVLGSRFRVTEALRHANKGGVYRAIDERDGVRVIVKQARAQTGAKLDGTDVRDVLRHEARILRELSPRSVFPAFVALFEEQGDLFLVEEEIEVGQIDDVPSVATYLVRAIRAVHETGMVLCDLKPDNVIVTPGGGVRLIDAEVVASPGDLGVRGYTVGFAAPELLEGGLARAPLPSADCFSLGVTLFCLATGGLAPHWVAGRRPVLTAIAMDRPALAPLLDLILGLTESDPSERWSLEQATVFLSSVPVERPLRPAVLLPADGLDRLLTDGLVHLRDGMTPQEPYLWRAGLVGQRYDPCDAWRGAAGVLATLTRAGSAEPVAEAAEWISERLDDVPRILPGLCFGRAGTAWALFDAGQFLDDARLKSRAVDLAKQLPTRGPQLDVAHGLAGAGLGLLWLWQRTGDADLHRAALACAESLLSAGFGATGLDGFAHGLAGEGMFLLATGEERYLDAALDAGGTLLRRSDTSAGPQLQWCNGPAGIGTFLIRLWAVTGEQRFADAAMQCALPAADSWAMSMGACCGLSGSGHLLLDLADFTGDDRFRSQAEALAGVIHAQASTVDGRLVTGPPAAGYAYAEGTAGVLDFLLRLRHGGPRPWLPDLVAGPLSPAHVDGIATDILEEVNTG